MIGEKSRLWEKSGRTQKGRPTPVSELTLRQVVPWPVPSARSGWHPPGDDWPLRPEADGMDRTAPRVVRIEIVVDPSQVRLLVELLRHILGSPPKLTTPSCPGQNGTLPAGPAFDLTPREEEVLEQMIEGKSNRQIALELEIATATVKCHVSNILSKMGAESRTEAATMALQRRCLQRRPGCRQSSPSKDEVRYE